MLVDEISTKVKRSARFHHVTAVEMRSTFSHMPFKAIQSEPNQKNDKK